MNFNEVIAGLNKNKEIRLQGKLLGIPWVDLPKLNKVIPGIQKKRYVCVTANQKVGKSMITNFLYMYQPIKYVYKYNPDIDLKIIYFSLELSEEELKRQYICHVLATECRVFIDPQNLAGMFEDFIPNEEIFKAIESQKDYLDFIDNHVDIVTGIRNPTGMYKYVRDFARKRGKFYLNNEEVDPVATNGLYDKYVPNNPNEHVIILTDHLGIMTIEKGEDKYSNIDKWSSIYCLIMRDQFEYTVVDIQQQTALSEQQQYTFKGDTIVSKLRPSADCLADNKSTSRNHNLLLSLFSPARFNIMQYPEYVAEHEKYNIGILNDNYRELSILLNRNGISNASLSLLFDGGSCNFKELPDPSPKMYEYYKEWKKEHDLTKYKQIT